VAFNLKNIIFSLFTPLDYRMDVNKDANGKGLHQRYEEMLASDMDVELIPYLENFLDNISVPDTVLDRFIPYLEDLYGIPALSSDIEIRRKLIKNIFNILKVKGTKLSYEIVFKILGYSTVEIVEYYPRLTFDSIITFDDPIRTFDSGDCYPCSPYDLYLTGPYSTITSEQLQIILAAVYWVEPINAKLKKVYYNELELENFTIFIDSNGDLIYDADSDVFTDFNLLENGDLYTNDNHIFIDNNANLFQDG